MPDGIRPLITDTQTTTLRLVMLKTGVALCCTAQISAPYSSNGSGVRALTNRHYQVHYLPASLSNVVDKHVLEQLHGFKDTCYL